ncbi:hypothetical protein DFH06DRAFT_158134 [Mycena polygramma]|nr:hypothetical protein DFH06DRAFT_158134 [Mycena polygramma]
MLQHPDEPISGIILSPNVALSGELVFRPLFKFGCGRGSGRIFLPPRFCQVHNHFRVSRRNPRNPRLAISVPQPSHWRLGGWTIFARIPPLEELFYWSVDPDGVRKLDASSVEQLRLPRLTCRTMTFGDSWTTAHYQALREVHKAKGFDPDTPDVATFLGYPLLTPNDQSRLEECGDNDTQCVLV